MSNATVLAIFAAADKLGKQHDCPGPYVTRLLVTLAERGGDIAATKQAMRSEGLALDTAYPGLIEDAQAALEAIQ